ncbi:MAG: Flp family type IVb pilin [Chloroflexota bacterium]
MMKAIRNLLNDEGGQGMTEYALIIGIVAVMLIAGLVLFRDEIVAVFNRITQGLRDNAVPPTP